MFTAAVLRQPNPAGEVLNVAGEEDLSGADIARIVSQKLDAEIRYVGISPQEFGDRLKPILGERAGKNWRRFTSSSIKTTARCCVKITTNRVVY